MTMHDRDDENGEVPIVQGGAAEDADESDLEGYDDEQRAEVLEAEQTDPFGRDLIHNLMPDEDGGRNGDGGLPDRDPVNDPAEDEL